MQLLSALSMFILDFDYNYFRILMEHSFFDFYRLSFKGNWFIQLILWVFCRFLFHLIPPGGAFLSQVLRTDYYEVWPIQLCFRLSPACTEHSQYMLLWAVGAQVTSTFGKKFVGNTLDRAENIDVWETTLIWKISWRYKIIQTWV